MIRNTIQSRIIYDAVSSLKTHPTADDIYEMVAPKCPGISKGTVYRVLGNLSAENRIKRVQIANAPDRFDSTLENHAHFFCRKCKKVFDFPMEECLLPSDSEFCVEKVEIVVTGICPECK